MVDDLLRLKSVPVQIEIGTEKLSNMELMKAACNFLKMAQDDSLTPIVAVEVRKEGGRVVINYLAEDTTPPFEKVWQKVITKTYTYTVHSGNSTATSFLNEG